MAELGSQMMPQTMVVAAIHDNRPKGGQMPPGVNSSGGFYMQFKRKERKLRCVLNGCMLHPLRDTFILQVQQEKIFSDRLYEFLLTLWRDKTTTRRHSTAHEPDRSISTDHPRVPARGHFHL
jgi:hypothetical protein